MPDSHLNREVGIEADFVPPVAIEKHSAEGVPSHAALLPDGYVIYAASGLWRTRRGIVSDGGDG